MLRLTLLALRLLILLLLASSFAGGCTDVDAPTVRQTRAPVLLTELGVYYEYAFEPARSHSRVALQLPGSSSDQVREEWIRELSELGAGDFVSTRARKRLLLWGRCHLRAFSVGSGTARRRKSG